MGKGAYKNRSEKEKKSQKIKYKSLKIRFKNKPNLKILMKVEEDLWNIR